MKVIAVIISLGFLSCNNYKNNTNVKSESTNIDSTIVDSRSKFKDNEILLVSDSIKIFIVDDYAVTDKMLSDKKNKDFPYRIKIDQIYSYDKKWFSNDTLNQTIVFELYTDYHRKVIYHFYNKNIPNDLINLMELHIEGGNLASENQKQNSFNGFIKESIRIDSKFFKTNKGFILGDSKQKAIDCYGKPDVISKTNEIEKLEWIFIGDEFYDDNLNLNGKPIAKDSFGHKIIMYFKGNLLVAQILYNDIP